MLKNRRKQLGQGMTEYIIIVALIAISAIAVYNIFGDTVRGQVGNMASELGGGTADTGNITGTVTAAGNAGTAETTLGNFEQAED